MSPAAMAVMPCTSQPVHVATFLQNHLELAQEDGFVFLDSGTIVDKDAPTTASRFSVLALDPWQDIRFTDQRTWLNGEPVSEDLFTTIRSFLRQHIKDFPADFLPPEVPFHGGLIGYVAYDLAAALDPAHLPLPEASDHDLPLAWLRAYDRMVIFDQWAQKAWLLAWGQLQPAQQALDSLQSALRAAHSDQNGFAAADLTHAAVQQEAATATNPVGNRAHSAVPEPFVVDSNFTRPDYLERVSQVRSAIGAGDVYILNLAQRMILPPPSEPFQTYLKLRQKSPTPYAAYLTYPDLAILSFSPELFLKISGRTAVTRPIKGTRPRGLTPEIDEKNRQALLQSEKDRAELLMIVDLERNDLSRVCTPESVTVEDLYGLESYATVHHLVATVSGELAPEHDAVSCFAALFPGGSITGAPKMRAMQLISSFETVRRGLYTGCAGFFSLDGQAEFNILIRTIIHSDQATTYHAGGGITWDSDPSAEYQETLDKTVALAEAFSC
ncbi:MAG: aminodeoxychorismate synthase component I [Clostridia bacterium]|nr:aminodeoxychorismate synthase component I [Clostridia bacterium]